MPASITLKIRVGPLVSFEVRGTSCKELTEAMKGYENLNAVIDSMFSDLAERVYPEGMEAEKAEPQERQSPEEGEEVSQ